MPKEFNPAQKKYFGKIVKARRVPVIIGYLWEQEDPLGESPFGKWIWLDDHIEPLKKGRKS